MSYDLKYEPVAFSSAHGDLVYVVHDTVKANAPLTYPNFKYVADVYVGGAMVSRLKIVPDPVNQFGVFNIGNIVRNYVDSQLTNPNFSAIKSDVLENYFAYTHIKFGNEYGVTPVLTTNLLMSSELNFYNYYTGRLVGVFENLSPYEAKILSTRPLRTNYMSGTSKYLIPFFINDSNYDLIISAYTASGSYISGVTIPQTPEISMPVIYNLSAVNINAIYPTIIPANAAYYTVTFDVEDPPGGWTQLTYRFDIVCEPRYTAYTLHFLNRLGGYESYSFSKVSKRGIDITKKDFTKLKYTIDSNGEMSYNNGYVMNDDKVTYYGNFKERLELNSDWLTQDQLTWLSELVKSPQVYIEENGFLVPFTITDQSFEFKQMASDRHFNLKIAGEYGDIKNVQYR
jgi:hypothetical protein